MSCLFVSCPFPFHSVQFVCLLITLKGTEIYCSAVHFSIALRDYQLPTSLIQFEASQTIMFLFKYSLFSILFISYSFAAITGPLTQDFQDWLKSNGYSQDDFVRADEHSTQGSYGGKTASANTVSFKTMKGVKFSQTKADLHRWYEGKFCILDFQHTGYFHPWKFG